MSMTTVDSLKKRSGTASAETESRGQLKISESLEKLQQSSTWLYTEMSGLAMPGETLAAFREIVREIGETRLESRAIEHEYQAAMSTLRAIESIQGAQDRTLSSEEMERLNSLPSAIEKATEEQEAFGREMDGLQAKFDALAVRLEQAETAFLETRQLKEDAQRRIDGAEKDRQETREELGRAQGEAEALRGEVAQTQEERQRLRQELDETQSEKNGLLAELDSARAQAEQAAVGTSAMENALASVRHDLEQVMMQAAESQSQLAGEIHSLRSMNESLETELNDARTRAEQAGALARGLEGDLASTRRDLENARSQVTESHSRVTSELDSLRSEREQLQFALENERAARTAEAEGAKSLSERILRLQSGLELARAEHERLSQAAAKASQELKEAELRLSGTEREKADWGSELDRATRGLRAANAARELAEDRERVLGEQRARDEARLLALEERVRELLGQRAEIEKELRVARDALKNVEVNVTALCAVQRRMRSGGGA